MKILNASRQSARCITRPFGKLHFSFFSRHSPDTPPFDRWRARGFSARTRIGALRADNTFDCTAAIETARRRGASLPTRRNRRPSHPTTPQSAPARSSCVAARPPARPAQRERQKNGSRSQFFRLDQRANRVFDQASVITRETRPST